MTTILCTGASSGIGAAYARRMAATGARIALVARRHDKLAALADDIRTLGGEALVLPADLTNEQACTDVVRATLDTFGDVDIVLNNAGRGNRASIEDTTTAMWREMFTLNVDAPFWITRAVLPAMRARNRGHIVNISSVAGRMAFPFNAAYVAAKHALVGFTAALRTELAGTDIQATVVCPAGVTTDWAAVSDGGAIGDIFARGISRSRAHARELGRPLAPLTPMMAADDIAAIIDRTVATGRSSDVYTHGGTQEQALQATANRVALEDQFLPLYLGMRDAYRDPSAR